MMEDVSVEAQMKIKKFAMLREKKRRAMAKKNNESNERDINSIIGGSGGNDVERAVIKEECWIDAAISVGKDFNGSKSSPASNGPIIEASQEASEYSHRKVVIKIPSNESVTYNNSLNVQVALDAANDANKGDFLLNSNNDCDLVDHMQIL